MVGWVRLDGRDQDGLAAMHYACSAGSAPVVQRLLDAGADMEALDAEQRTGLSYAAAADSAAVVQLLVRRGVGAAAIQGALQQHGASPDTLALLQAELDRRDRPAAPRVARGAAVAGAPPAARRGVGIRGRIRRP